MGQAAVPAYLGPDFSTAAPGHRFNLYLPFWRAGSWAREPDKPAGKDGGSPATGKAPTFRTVVGLDAYFAGPLGLSRQLGDRQAALAAALAEQGQLLTHHAVAVAPFTTGLGNAHPLENGFAFLNPYGLAYLPGSGVKGVLRQAARELADHLWGDDLGWTTAAIETLFGKTGEATDAHDNPILQRGALMFWDVLPQIVGDALQVEVMTPHQTHYYQKGDSPHESGQPNPIHFLTVPPGSKFVFHVQCDLDRLTPDLARDAQWQGLLTAALTHAFQWLGFGAKTAVGYGAMAKDEGAAAEQQRQGDAQRAQRQAEQAAAQRQGALASLSPTERTIQQLLDARVDKNQSELAALMSALKKSQHSSEVRIAMARQVQAALRQAGKWREKTDKKNPLKDHDHQDTLLVIKWLAGS